MSSNSVCNHSRDKQIRHFVIIRMITDRIGLHLVLLPLPKKTWLLVHRVRMKTSVNTIFKEKIQKSLLLLKQAESDGPKFILLSDSGSSKRLCLKRNSSFLVLLPYDKTINESLMSHYLTVS